jgi:hypothetical protein
MALAASTQKIGFAFFTGRQVMDWGVVRKASRNVDAAYSQTITWIEYYGPSCVFVEEIDGGTRKGRHSVALIHAFVAAAQSCRLEVIAVPRRVMYSNKYVEAAALAEHHPQLRYLVPKTHRAWESEPHRMVIFEAVALVEQWFAIRSASRPG